MPASLGGDLGYRYGLEGPFSGSGWIARLAVLMSSQIATAPQALQPLATLQQGPQRLG